jgi:hypothetical protein
MNANKTIKNEQWYVKSLICKIKNNEIFKPKYQRKRKWDILPTKKSSNPSEKNYILFLFDTRNSVHAITFGEFENNLSNIDGNNRINAIHHFLDEPFALFPEYLNDIFSFIDTSFEISIGNQIKEIITKISYNDLMLFKYNKYFIDNGMIDLYNNNLKNKRDEMEPHFEELITKLKLDGEDRFDTNVEINVNLFYGYTTEELCKIFGDINQYNGKLTDIEMLACRLYNIYDFEITDVILKVEIVECIKEFYAAKNEGEALKCYSYNDNDRMNAYDFMVGLQNYAHKKCKIIEPTDNDGSSLFFKIYKTIYRGSYDQTFTSENVNNFITYIKKTIDILNRLSNIVFMENLVSENNKIFDACNKKLYSLKKNNLYIIIASIFGYIRKNEKEHIILRSIEKCILFHFFVNDILIKEEKDKYRLLDSIIHEAGGAFIDAKAREVYGKPELISERITQQIMTNVLNDLIIQNIKNKNHEVRETGKNKLDRRCRKFHEKALLYYYYINKVPSGFLKNKFWIEHIFPFSSSWEDTIDIDRLGNIIPIIDNLNSLRKNKHIKEYETHDKNNFIKCINDIIPTQNEYNKIIDHTDQKPHIKCSSNYNKICERNEEILKNKFIQHIFG